jgi:hypothetical protein
VLSGSFFVCSEHDRAGVRGLVFRNRVRYITLALVVP